MADARPFEPAANAWAGDFGTRGSSTPVVNPDGGSGLPDPVFALTFVNNSLMRDSPMRGPIAVIALLLSCVPVLGADGYDRALFQKRWQDVDGDCQDQRHEMLLKRAIIVTQMSANRCRVIRGQWRDPYSGRMIRNARQVHIDHLIPLKWAWDRGASGWTPDRRAAFAVDNRFLIVAAADLNRAKGARGPQDWLPPVDKCAYVLQFRRGVLVWHLNPSAVERADLKRLTSLHCATAPGS